MCGSAQTSARLYMKWTRNDVRRGPFGRLSAAQIAGASLDRPANESSETEPPQWRTQRSGRTPRSALSERARRHLWMHFTRLGARPARAAADHRVRARAATSTTRTASATSTGSRRCSASTSATAAPSSREAAADAAARARLLHELELRAPARDRARRARSPALAPGDLQPRLLHLGRLRGGRVGAEARARLPPADRQARRRSR